MEISCNRCHQAIPDASCFCPACGLPQLVYASEEGETAVSAERWTDAVRDAGQVEWRPALRAAIVLSIPAGILASNSWPVGLFWAAFASAWAVYLYARRQRPQWITMGAGARIGLVTGLMTGWLAFVVSGASLFTLRFLLGEGKVFDGPWEGMVAHLSQQWQAAGSDPQTLAFTNAFAKWLLSPWGRAGMMLGCIVVLEIGLLLFAAAGGALGARMMARSRRAE
jgi:hypothetical protein